MIKISVLKDISILEFYGYIEYILMNIFTQILVIKQFKIYLILHIKIILKYQLAFEKKFKIL